jgi:23S rRNA-/tRNA-specific pseudouridylate synthase
VINKPSGLMVEPDRNNHPNLLQQVKAYLKSSLADGDELYAQHIHRLDRPVSGIVLFAKQRAVLKNLSEQFAERKVKKFYRALTEQAPENLLGRIEHWHRKEKKKAALYNTEIEYSEKAVLEYMVTNLSKDRYLWEITLHTGKYHQIRAQLASLGCPIIGDELYGSAINYRPNSIALDACGLIIHHPISGIEIALEKSPEF